MELPSLGAGSRRCDQFVHVHTVCPSQVERDGHSLIWQPRRSNLSYGLRPLQRGLFILEACARHYSITPLRAKQVVAGFSVSRTPTPYVRDLHSSASGSLTELLLQVTNCATFCRGNTEWSIMGRS